MSDTFDLFGDPVPEGWGKRGRPAHIPTLENRNKVMLLLALGWDNERIATALRITPPTLRKNYFRELKLKDDQAVRLEAAIGERLWASAKKGNVAAMRELRAEQERNNLKQYGQTERPAVSAKEAKLGKKDQARHNALAPDTGSTLGELMALRQDMLLN